MKRTTTRTTTTAGLTLTLAAMMLFAGAPAGGIGDGLTSDLSPHEAGQLEGAGDRPQALLESVEQLKTAWATHEETTPGFDGTHLSGCAEAGDTTPWHEALEVACSLQGLSQSPVAIPLSNYEVCDVTGTICVVQEDGSPSDPSCDSGYLASYGPVLAQNGVYVDDLWIRAYEQCAYWFISTDHDYGFRASGSVGGTDILVLWRAYEREANPQCNYGATHLERSDILVRTDDFELRWGEATESACPSGAGPTECSTTLQIGSDVEDLDCPLGPPPRPPTPEEFPYGGLLP